MNEHINDKQIEGFHTMSIVCYSYGLFLSLKTMIFYKVHIILKKYIIFGKTLLEINGLLLPKYLIKPMLKIKYKGFNVTQLNLHGTFYSLLFHPFDLVFNPLVA